MALNVYSPPETAVIHKTTVDIGNIRPMAQVVKLTQGDKSLPLIAVKLLNSGQPYEVPESATDAVFNFRKGDRKAVINSALGVSSDRQTVYVEATEQTCAAAGRGEAIVQIQVGEQVAGTGIFCVDVTPNPTTDASISDTEIGVLQGLVDEANDAKADAQQSASEASQSASDAQESAGEASDSATLAGQHKDDAESAKNSAEQFANTAEQEATNAENARDQAEVYMEKAQASSAVSNSSYYIGEDGMLHLKFDSDGLGQNDIDQTLSELQSDVAELQSDIDQDRDMLNAHTTQISQANAKISTLEKANADYIVHIDSTRTVALQIDGNPTWTPVLQNALTYDFKIGGYYLLILNGVRVKYDNPSGNLSFAYSVDGNIKEQIFSVGESIDVKEMEMPIIALVNIPQGTHTVNIHVRNDQMQALTFLTAWTVGQLILIKI